MAAVASCVVSATPVAAMRCSLFLIPVMVFGVTLPDSFSIKSGKPGMSKFLASLPRGSSSNVPIAAPRKLAAPLSSSLAPYALARSDASPAPAPRASIPAAGSAALPNTAVLANAPSEPTPDANLYVRESLSPPSGVKSSCISSIFSLAFSSASSSSTVAAPKAAVAVVPTKPAPRPVAIFSKNPTSSSVFFFLVELSFFLESGGIPNSRRVCLNNRALRVSTAATSPAASAFFIAALISRELGIV